MANYSKKEMEDNILKQKLGIAGALTGIVAFAVKTAVDVAINKKLGNDIDLLELSKKNLEEQFLGRWRNKDEIKNIDWEIAEKRSQKK